jgi:xylulokinase
MPSSSATLLEAGMSDVVIGVDASTTAVKAIAFSREGEEIYRAKAAYPLSNPHPGHFEQDPEDWWSALTEALGQVARALGPERISALSIAHQRESFTLLDERGKPLIPAILWLDERARPQVEALCRKAGRDTLRDWSGKPPDPTPALYALAWLSEHRPEVMQKAAAVVDTGGFLMHRLTGRLVTSVASADPLGLIDIAGGRWHPQLVRLSGLRPDQLPDLAKPGAIVGNLSDAVARRTGLSPDTLVVAGAGDGQAMGLGMGVAAEGRTYVSVGSGVVSGAYSRAVAASDAFRTLASPTGRGYMLETVLRSGMQLVDWLVRLTSSSSIAALEDQARKVPIGSDGVLVMPYWAGVMSPYWDGAARGAIFGLSLDHSPATLLRAVMEGIAFEQRVATDAMEAATGTPRSPMIAAGGGTNSQLLMQILASVLERPIEISPVQESAALGGAMLAARAVEWFSSIDEACQAMAPVATHRADPVDALVADYRQRLPIYREMYGATRDVHQKLAKLAAGRGARDAGPASR